MTTPRDVASDIPAVVREVGGVTGVELSGSRARGEAGRFSDWDFLVSTSDFSRTERDLPIAVRRLDPLAFQWDRLSDEPCFMLILPGAVKVDLIFDELPNTHEPAWTVDASTLAGIDAHFWDWSLWLTSKVDAGKGEFVEAELDKMHEHLLGPMGVRTPTSVPEAVDLYLAARERWEERLGVRIDPSLGDVTKPVIDLLRQ